MFWKGAIAYENRLVFEFQKMQAVCENKPCSEKGQVTCENRPVYEKEQVVQENRPVFEF